MAKRCGRPPLSLPACESTSPTEPGWQARSAHDTACCGGRACVACLLCADHRPAQAGDGRAYARCGPAALAHPPDACMHASMRGTLPPCKMHACRRPAHIALRRMLSGPPSACVLAACAQTAAGPACRLHQRFQQRAPRALLCAPASTCPLRGARTHTHARTQRAYALPA